VSEAATKLPPVERFEAAGGARIYRLSSEAFPNFVVHAYLVLEAGEPTLVDAGSGYGDATGQLLAGFDAVRQQFGETVRPEDIRRVVVTHGHIDHFGGLPALIDKMPQARIAIHELDRRILTAYEERVIVASTALRIFFQQAGVPGDRQSKLMEMYNFSKRHVRSLPVDVTLVDGQTWDGLRFVHVPGHCPGQVCIGIGDVLLTADHVLPVITPHQSPESITQSTGLGHYLDSLAKVQALPDVRIGLGGHEGPIVDIYKRVDEIRASHRRKLDKIFDVIRLAPEPVTVDDITQRLYARVKGFDTLLALEEVGAHVEYLYQRGRLEIANLDQIESETNPAIKYRGA
jgi:glyoxylase-like metal-dependent hydrolase (beta-lactamase superfamily II)